MSQPQRIASYLVERELGEGSFGTVFLAHDVEKFERTVAIKVLKPGPRSRDVRARFLAEQNALGMMDHEFVTKIYESGETEDGRPYFVMEYVDGEPITAWCDARRLDTAARLALFADVCLGILHAHQKGIIHRDVKPSNVLVTEREGQPVPKIIDFGLARGEDRLLFAGQLPTLGGAVLGTLVYMSPEQARGDRDIDTRADLYSLGILLYELIAGVLPFDLDQLERLGPKTALGRVLADPPPPPSERAPDARSRRRLRGELDWIVMRALAEDRERRYATAAALREDVQRYLDAQPVLARPPGRLYRLRKFVQRNRTEVVAGAALLGLLVAVTVGTTLGLLQARENERLARDNARLAQDKVDAVRRRERQNAEALFRSAQLAAQRGQWPLALQQLDNAERAGYGEEHRIELTIDRIKALEGSLDHAAAATLLGGLRRDHESGVHDLGDHRAEILLLEGDLGIDRLADPDAKLDLVREALTLGTLAPADAAYARALLADDVTAALDHLRQARLHDPYHRRANDTYAITLLCCGRLDDAVAFADVLRSATPDDTNALLYAAFVATLRGAPDDAAQLITHIRDHIDPETADLARFAADTAALTHWFNDTVVRRLVQTEAESFGRVLSDFLIPLTKVWNGQQAMRQSASDPRQTGVALFRVPPCVVRAYHPLFAGFPRNLFRLDRLLEALDAYRDKVVDGAVHFAHGLLLINAERFAEAVEAMARATATPSVIIRPKTGQFFAVAAHIRQLRALGDENPAERAPLRTRCAAAVARASGLDALGPDEFRFLCLAADEIDAAAIGLEVALRWAREHPTDAEAKAMVSRFDSRR